MRLTRRAFAISAGAGLATMAGAAGHGLLASAVAPPAKAEYRTLSPAEAATLEGLAEALVPGARDAGVARFIDDQLSVPAEKCALIVRYLGVALPFARFYKDAAHAADAAATNMFGGTVEALGPEQMNALVAAIAAGKVDDWSGPAPQLFHFVLRSDGIDVVYGTRAGFDRLDIPYMAHIVPPSDW